MTSAMVRHDAERSQRLSAIAHLELQRKNSRGRVIDADAGSRGGDGAKPGSSSSFESSGSKKKHFLLLVSKGSEKLEQRGDQDHAEALLRKYPLEIMDGSNHTNASRQEALFNISKDRENYPQLFLVDNGDVSYIGGFAAITSHAEEGLLRGMLAETRSSVSSKSSSSKVRKSVVRSMKSFKIVLGRGSKKDAPSSPATNTEPPLPTDEMNNSGALETPASDSVEEHEYAFEEMDVPLNSSGTPVLTKEKTIMNPRSDGVIPLEVKKKKERKRRSKSLEQKSGGSRSSLRDRSDEEIDDLDLSSRSASSTTSRRSLRASRSIIRGSVARRRWEDSQKDLSADIIGSDLEENDKPSSHSRRSRSRSVSRGVSRRSQARQASTTEDTNENNNSSSSHKGRSRKSISRTKSKASEKDGTEDRAARRKSGVRSSSPHALGSARRTEETGDRKSRPRKSHIRNKTGTGERSRRSQTRSTSPHAMAWRRENQQRPSSPGVVRGGGVFARKREAMKEYREKKSQNALAMEAPGLESPRKPRKKRNSGAKDMRTSSSSVRRSRSSIAAVRPERDNSPEPKDESLNELFKRVKEEKKGKPTNPPTELRASQVGTAVAW